MRYVTRAPALETPAPADRRRRRSSKQVSSGGGEKRREGTRWTTCTCCRLLLDYCSTVTPRATIISSQLISESTTRCILPSPCSPSPSSRHALMFRPTPKVFLSCREKRTSPCRHICRGTSRHRRRAVVTGRLAAVARLFDPTQFATRQLDPTPPACAGRLAAVIAAYFAARLAAARPSVA